MKRRKITTDHRAPYQGYASRFFGIGAEIFEPLELADAGEAAVGFDAQARASQPIEAPVGRRRRLPLDRLKFLRHFSTLLGLRHQPLAIQTFL